MRTDERDATPGWPRGDVACHRCGTTVQVRKSSLAQTSVQWRGDAAARCAELAEHRAAGQQPGLVPACEALRKSIDEAVRDGLLPVTDA